MIDNIKIYKYYFRTQKKSEIMTKILYKPYDTIYVRDMIKLNLDDFTGMMSSLEAVNAYWVDGVLFASFAMTESEELAKKEMQNEMFLDKIIFSTYKEYTKTVKSSTNLEIGVLNMQKSKLYVDLITWLKTQPIWNE